MFTNITYTINYNIFTYLSLYFSTTNFIVFIKNKYSYVFLFLMIFCLKMEMRFQNRNINFQPMYF